MMQRWPSAFRSLRELGRSQSGRRGKGRLQELVNAEPALSVHDVKRPGHLPAFRSHHGCLFGARCLSFGPLRSLNGLPSLSPFWAGDEHRAWGRLCPSARPKAWHRAVCRAGFRRLDADVLVVGLARGGGEFRAWDLTISNFVSRSKILIEPISFFVTWPRRQMIGRSQRGSALLRRPTLMRNHTMSSEERSNPPSANPGPCP